MEHLGTVTILVGPSGAGKTSWTLAHGFFGCAVSADHYFIDGGGVYRFDVTKLGEAHGACLRDFILRLTSEADHGGMRPPIIVDNTNSTVMEAAPYIAAALAYGRRVEIVVFRTPADIAAPRNVHGVPEAGVRRMADTISREWPGALPWHWQPKNNPAVTLREIDE